MKDRVKKFTDQEQTTRYWLFRYIIRRRCLCW